MKVWRKHPHLHLLPTRGRRVRVALEDGSPSLARD
jgi:hypothetical protein